MDSLGTCIRKARERRGMSQGQLAQKLGVSLRTVGNWERDETSPRSSLTRIEDLLGPVGPHSDDPTFVAFPDPEADPEERPVTTRQLREEMALVRQELGETVRDEIRKALRDGA